VSPLQAAITERITRTTESQEPRRRESIGSIIDIRGAPSSEDVPRYVVFSWFALDEGESG
jgi:hypothetical protein